MTKKYEVAVVGEIFADHILSGFKEWPAPGTEIFTDKYMREIGGGAPNTACALAKLGRRTLLCGIAGAEDQLWLSRRMQGFGVLLDGIRYANESTGVTISISTPEDRTFFTYRGSNSQLDEYLQDPVLIRRLLEASHVHFAMPLTYTTARSLLPQLKQAGCTLSIDVGWQPEWLTNVHNLATCKSCDLFLPNEKEAEIFTGLEGPAEMLRAFMQSGISGAVIKLGPRGAATMLDGKLHSVGSIQVTPVDTTGAGDAFDAGLIDAFLDKVSVDGMLRRACICGALSTRVSGALNGLPTRKELDESYERS